VVTGPRRYSTAFDASEALANILDGELANPTVLWGLAGEPEAAAEELVSVGDVEPPSEQETAALGLSPAPRRREEYVVEVVVDVAQYADAHATVNRRCRDITQDIERSIDEHPTLDGALYDDGWCVPQRLRISQLRDTESGAFRTIAHLRVFATARI
jgi:hypothetical protein